MKTLIALILLSVGGSAGWMLRSNLEPASVLVQQNEGRSVVPSFQAPKLTRSAETPLDANTGNSLLFEKSFISHIWIRSIRPDGRFGSKHLFLKVDERPPLSGSYQLARYAFYDRPDLQDRLPLTVEPLRRGEISTMIHIRGVEHPRMSIWVQEPERIVDIPENQFPKTLEQAWNIAHERLSTFSVKTT